MRVVLDTNVIVSAFLTQSGAPAQIFELYQQDKFDLVVSEPILAEYQEALNYPKVQTRHQMSPREITTVIEEVRRAAILVMPTVEVYPTITDKDDIKLFACAVAGYAEYIVSGDKLVQAVNTYQGIQVLPSRGFLTVLSEDL